MEYLIGSFLIGAFMGAMSHKYFAKGDKCVLCRKSEGKYCSACYQTLKAEYIALQTEQRNTLRSIECFKKKVG